MRTIIYVFPVVIMLIFNVCIVGFIDIRIQKYHIIISVLFVPGCFVLNLCEYLNVSSQSHCYDSGKAMQS